MSKVSGNLLIEGTEDETSCVCLIWHIYLNFFYLTSP